MTLALFIAAGYLLGSVPFGYWLVRLAKGVDIRTLGSGNIGATNVWRVYGPRYGLPVMLLDSGKAFAPALAATLVDDSLAGVLTGGAAMLGHARPLFLGFARGGKTVATAGGAFLGVAPFVGLIGVGVWLVVFLLTRYASVASIIAAAALPPLSFALGEPWPVIAFGGAASGAVVLLHRQNIGRLLAGTENRIELRRPRRDAPTARAEPSSGQSP